jgi:uncharacterized protein YabN with tetrapyrrole methylase and pyrophosphatase domain
MSGRLTVVGTGIRSVAQTTREAADAITAADKAFYVVADPVTEAWLQELNATAESLYDAYGEGKPRLDSYREMVDRILAPVREGKRVVAIFYGHPGVFVNPSHAAIARARAEGYRAEMLPGVSAEDCLFADVGIDPAPVGCCTFEATDFLVHHRRFDPSSHLVLWQIGVIGEPLFRKDRPKQAQGLALLVERLLEHYSPDHELVIYQAPELVILEPLIERVRLADLAAGPVTPMSTLYVPPRERRTADPAVLQRLGLPLRGNAPQE